MQVMFRFRNFILSLLLCTLIAAGFHAHPVPVATIASQTQGTALFLDSHTLSQPDDLWTTQLSSRRSSTTFSNGIRTTRIGFSYRFNILFSLCILTLLSVFSKLIENLFIFQDIRYVYQENFMISFIQDTDGRKRLSYL